MKDGLMRTIMENIQNVSHSRVKRETLNRVQGGEQKSTRGMLENAEVTLKMHNELSTTQN